MTPADCSCPDLPASVSLLLGVLSGVLPVAIGWFVGAISWRIAHGGER